MKELTVSLNEFINYNYSTKILTAFIIFLFFLFLRKVFSKYIIKALLKLSKKTSSEIDDRLIESFKKPLNGIFVVIGLLIAFYILPLSTEIKTTVFVLSRSMIIILIAWGINNFLDSSSFLFSGIQKRVGLELNEAVVPFISKLLKAVLITLAGVLVISELGYDISGFIAGLGLGGLAFALAAQDTAANIFGGIIVLLDKPFTVGDWIVTPSVEGVVEEINLRSTRVRTFAQSLVVMPNSKLTNEPITNWSKMGKRRVRFNVGVTYDTSKEILQKSVDRIKNMLEEHPDVHKETIVVRFDTFNSSSLDILVYFFTNTIEWQKYLEIKENVNYKIMEIIEQEGTSFAFPSRSIYIEQTPDPKQEKTEKQENI